jgi:GTPase SAR1 family protein
MIELYRKFRGKREPEYVFKIVLIGNTELKTDWVRQIVDNIFLENTISVTGVDFSLKNIVIKGKNIILQLWDINCQESFRKNRPYYYQGSHAAVLCFDKGEQQSFKAVENLLNEFLSFTDSRFPIALVGLVTKSEEITTELGQQLADKLDMSYFETTPTDKKKSLEIFHFLAKNILIVHEQV